MSFADKRIEYLGTSKVLPEDDLPNLRGCLRFIIYLREQAIHQEEEPDMTIIAREVYNKVSSLYFKANAKLSPPVIMSEAVGMQKLTRFWGDVNDIVRRQKGFNRVEKRVSPQLDRLFDLIYCQCPITCV